MLITQYQLLLYQPLQVLQFAQERFSEEVREYVVITIGSLSIAGIITTIYQFLKISEINEGHRVALLSWGKFHRNLESELTST